MSCHSSLPRILILGKNLLLLALEETVSQEFWPFLYFYLLLLFIHHRKTFGNGLKVREKVHCSTKEISLSKPNCWHMSPSLITLVCISYRSELSVQHIYNKKTNANMFYHLTFRFFSKFCYLSMMPFTC